MIFFVLSKIKRDILYRNPLNEMGHYCLDTQYTNFPLQLGETYEAGDGCNLCVCRKAGDVPTYYEKEPRKVFGACTKILCPKQEPLKPKMNPNWSPKKEY